MFPFGSCMPGKFAMHLQSRQGKLDKQEGARKRGGERESWDGELDVELQVCFFQPSMFSSKCLAPSRYRKESRWLSDLLAELQQGPGAF